MIANVQRLLPARPHNNQTRSGRMATRQHLANQANQVGLCFVINENTATFDVRAMDDNDEIWATEANHRTGWNKTFKSGTYRGMLYGIVLRGYPKQVVSLALAKSVLTYMREFLSWTQRHDRIDVPAPTVERKTGGPVLLARAQLDEKSFLTKVRKLISSGLRARSVVPFERNNVIRHDKDPATCSHRHMDHRESNAHTRKTYCVDCGNYIDSVPREIFNALEATRSAPSNRDEEQAGRVSRDTTFTKQQIDLATI